MLFYLLKYIHDGIVQLSEHHKVDRKAGAAILSGRVTRKPGQCIVLLQNEPAEEKCREKLNQNSLLLSFFKIDLNLSQVSPGDVTSGGLPGCINAGGVGRVGNSLRRGAGEPRSFSFNMLELESKLFECRPSPLHGRDYGINGSNTTVFKALSFEHL